MESYKPHREIVHRHVFIDVVFRPEDRELTIETLDYPDTYFVKWFTHVCYRGQQDRVGKDQKFPFIFIVIFMIIDQRGVPLPFCINALFYLYRYGRGAYSIFVCPLDQFPALLFITRGRAAWQLARLITLKSRVQIPSPQHFFCKKNQGCPR